MRTLPVSEAKATLNALVDSVANTWEPVTLTRHGKPLVVIQAVDDFDAAQETAERLSDPETLPDVAEAKDAIASGDPGLSVGELRQELGLDA